MEGGPPSMLPGLAAGETLRARHGGRRVLVAEDEEVIRLALVEVLADAGLRVDQAGDGCDAVERAAARSYELVLLDLGMPRLDGLGAARAIRALPGHLHTPLVAVTAQGTGSTRQACADAAIDELIDKPVTAPVLLDTAQRWLDRSAGTAVASLAAAPGPARGQQPLAVAPGVEPLLCLDGLDALAGLAAVGGKVPSYRRLLGVFVTTHADDAARLRRLLDSDEPALASRLAHGVRGSAATLGLIGVEVAAAALEQALHAGEPAATCAERVDAFAQALTAAVGQLRQALSAE